MKKEEIQKRITTEKGKFLDLDKFTWTKNDKSIYEFKSEEYELTIDFKDIDNIDCYIDSYSKLDCGNNCYVYGSYDNWITTQNHCEVEADRGTVQVGKNCQVKANGVGVVKAKEGSSITLQNCGKVEAEKDCVIKYDTAFTLNGQKIETQKNVTFKTITTYDQKTFAIKKPINIQAYDLLTDKGMKLIDGIETEEGEYKNRMYINTLEGKHYASKKGDDYVIIGVKGEKYFIKREIFFETYDIVNN